MKHIFVDMEGAGDGAEGFSVKFLFGLNDTVKSAFLEAVELIFSRISQDELPGFWFDIEYTVFINNRDRSAAVFFFELFYTAGESWDAGAEKMCDWVSENESGRTAVCLLGGEPSHFCAEALRRRYQNPLQLLTVLLQGRRDDALKECHVFFHANGSKELLDKQQFEVLRTFIGDLYDVHYKDKGIECDSVLIQYQKMKKRAFDANSLELCPVC